MSYVFCEIYHRHRGVLPKLKGISTLYIIKLSLVPPVKMPVNVYNLVPATTGHVIKNYIEEVNAVHTLQCYAVLHYAPVLYVEPFSINTVS